MSWSDFIATQTLADQASAPFLAYCSHLAVIRASGEDAAGYLQGQLSCDLREVDQGAQRTAMHLSLKGRGLVSVRLVRDGDDYLLLCPAAMAQATIKALSKYKLRSKVEFAVDDTQVVLGVAGELPGDLAMGQSLRNDQGLWLRYPFSDHALLVCPAEQVQDSWQALAAGRALSNAAGWLLADIEAGEGQVYPGAEDLFLPQVLNYDVTAGVNFKKGCYTGQEVVARMHFKGKLKQRMQRIAFQASVDLQPGEVLRDGDGKAAGEVVISSGQQALVVLRRDSGGALFKDDIALDSQLLALPYALPWKD